MFGENLGNSLVIAGAIILIIFNIYSLFDQMIKARKYKNDERYQEIQKKVALVVTLYYAGLLASMTSIFIISTFFKSGFPATMEKLAMFIFYIIFLKGVVQYLAFRYYDKRM